MGSFLNVPPASNMAFFGGIHVSFPGCKLWKLTFSHQTTTSIAPRSPKSSGLRPRSNKPPRFEQYPSGMPPKNIPMMFQDFRNIQQVGFCGLGVCWIFSYNWWLLRFPDPHRKNVDWNIIKIYLYPMIYRYGRVHIVLLKLIAVKMRSI